MYGRQAFDRRYVYNMFVVYQPPFFKGQQGLMGRVLGGWTFGTVFTAGRGSPIEIYTDRPEMVRSSAQGITKLL